MYNILDMMAADSSGRETSLLSGFILGGDSSLYCRTAGKYAWSHPGRVINSSVISVFITQTEIDIQGSDSSGFLWQRRAPFFKHLETWIISEKLFDCFIVLFMKSGSALKYLHTNKLQLFQAAFLFRQLSVHVFLSGEMHIESFMAFFDHAVMRLFNLAVILCFLHQLNMRHEILKVRRCLAKGKAIELQKQ